MGAVATILFAAAIAPGPNNLVVMNAARSRLSHAFAPMAGVVLGTLAIVLALRVGAGAAIAALPAVVNVIRVAGAGLLAYLAWRTAQSGWSETVADRTQASGTALFLPMMALQVVNPKTWVLATTVSSAHIAHETSSIAALAMFTVLVPSACLLAWALAGRSLGNLLERPKLKRGFAVLMGLVLLGFAGTILFQP